MKATNDMDFNDKKLGLQQQQVVDKADAISKDLELKVKQIEQKDRSMMNDRYIAEINKN